MPPRGRSCAVVEDGDGLAGLHLVLVVRQVLRQRARRLRLDRVEVLHDLHEADGLPRFHGVTRLLEPVRVGTRAAIEDARNGGHDFVAGHALLAWSERTSWTAWAS